MAFPLIPVIIGIILIASSGGDTPQSIAQQAKKKKKQYWEDEEDSVAPIVTEDTLKANSTFSWVIDHANEVRRFYKDQESYINGFAYYFGVSANSLLKIPLFFDTLDLIFGDVDTGERPDAGEIMVDLLPMLPRAPGDPQKLLPK